MPPILHPVSCPQCGKSVGVRADQFGRKLRCPSCSHKFRIDSSPESGSPPLAGETLPMAAEAGEIVVANPSRGQPNHAAKATPSFSESPSVVLDAIVFAVRRAGCDVLDLDRNNLRLKFAAMLDGIRSEYTIYVFATPTGGAELDMNIPAAGPPSQAILYARIAAEISDYLAKRAKSEKLPTVEPEPARRERERDRYDDRDDWDDRPRKRREEPIDGLAIGGIVGSILGVLFCWLVVAGVILGAAGGTMGYIAMMKAGRRKDNGLAIASIIIGGIAVLISIIFFAIEVYSEIERRRRGW